MHVKWSFSCHVLEHAPWIPGLRVTGKSSDANWRELLLLNNSSRLAEASRRGQEQPASPRVWRKQIQARINPGLRRHFCTPRRVIRIRR